MLFLQINENIGKDNALDFAKFNYDRSNIYKVFNPEASYYSLKIFNYDKDFTSKTVDYIKKRFFEVLKSNKFDHTKNIFYQLDILSQYDKSYVLNNFDNIEKYIYTAMNVNRNESNIYFGILSLLTIYKISNKNLYLESYLANYLKEQIKFVSNNENQEILMLNFPYYYYFALILGDEKHEEFFKREIENSWNKLDLSVSSGYGMHLLYFLKDTIENLDLKLQIPENPTTFKEVYFSLLQKESDN